MFLKYLLRIFSICFICFFISKNIYAEEKIYTLGVIPQYPAITIHKNWMPFVRYLSKETGVNIQLQLSKDFQDFEKKIFSGELDFVFMNPYYAVKAHKQQGYIPLVRDEFKKLVGIVVVRQDSSFKNIQDLNNKKFAFPAPNAFGASHYIRTLLSEKEHIVIKDSYLKTHDNVYRQVVLGSVEAGGGVYRTLSRQPQYVQEQLRVIYKTPGVTSHPLSAHSRISKSLQKDMINAILKLKYTQEGKVLLKNIQMTEPIESNYQSDYQYLEQLGLEKYWITETQ